jgi:hypothetical protein
METRFSTPAARGFLLVLLTLAGCGTTRVADASTLDRQIAAAAREAAACLRAAGFEVTPDRLVNSVVMLDGSAKSMERFAVEVGAPPEAIPPTFAGTVVGETLYLVTEERYREIWRQLYGERQWTEASHRQLAVHELAHRAHELVAIGERGTADAMGPVWFFEGLAVMCARQFDDDPLLTREQIAAHFADGRTPPVSYPLYGAIVRSLAANFDFRELILRASEADFPLNFLRAPE